MVNQYDYISLNKSDNWMFKPGTDASWAKGDINVKDWQHLKPNGITDKFADNGGKFEGWLRLKIMLDTSFAGTSLDIAVFFWAAVDLYIDGDLQYSYGNTGGNGKRYREYNPFYKVPAAFNVEKGKVHLLALHLVDYRSPLPPYHLKSSGNFNDIIICLPDYEQGFLNWNRTNQTFKTIWISVNAILCCLFWLLAFQNRREKNIMLISVTSTAFAITIASDSFIPFPHLSFFGFRMLEIVWAVFLSVSSILTIILLVRIFERSFTRPLKWLLTLIALCAPVIIFYPTQWVLIFEIFIVNAIYVYYIVTSWKNLKGAQWAVLAGIVLTMMLGFVLAFTANDNSSFVLSRLLYTGVFLSFPLSLLVYVSMRFKEIIEDVRKNAAEVVLLSEEKREQALNHQKLLQDEVNRQTAELRNTLKNLKDAQAQLIQSEKMASLGELTAGIAHEIQNPLNFVNNFSEVNKELIEEVKSEKIKDKSERNDELEMQLLEDIEKNLEKISHHGRRADAIVKGMLQHSRTSTSMKEPTDINKLADEYLRLAFHGLRAKDKSFNAKIETDFDNSVGKIDIVPQEIGRVLLNLINNAFYAVNEKTKLLANSYEPLVKLTTRKLKDKIEIRVVDNGNGIPKNIADKIFQPFFTTKPTGQGTGLGLSLAYDIVKAHGGEIKVETKEREGSEFSIQLAAIQ
jgi:signal transduction histidine kinase